MVEYKWNFQGFPMATRFENSKSILLHCSRGDDTPKTIIK